jgi:zinc and cadmium transporter
MKTLLIICEFFYINHSILIMVLFEIFASVLLVSAVSLVGIVTLALKEAKLRRILLYLVSFSAGTMLGGAFIHLIPEAAEGGFSITLSSSVLFGIVFSFALEKVIHWRHCHTPVGKGHPHPFAYMNLFGDFVHNFIDGLIIAASYIAGMPTGIATTVAVLLHEIPQEIGDFGVLIHGGFTRKKAVLYNFLTALSAVLGAAVAVVASSAIQGAGTFLLGLAAGGFIYIAASDLIPELHKSSTCDSFSSRAFVQMMILVIGMIVMYSLTLLE